LVKEAHTEDVKMMFRRLWLKIKHTDINTLSAKHCHAQIKMSLNFL